MSLTEENLTNLLLDWTVDGQVHAVGESATYERKRHAQAISRAVMHWMAGTLNNPSRGLVAHCAREATFDLSAREGEALGEPRWRVVRSVLAAVCSPSFDLWNEVAVIKEEDEED